MYKTPNQSAREFLETSPELDRYGDGSLTVNENMLENANAINVEQWYPGKFGDIKDFLFNVPNGKEIGLEGILDLDRGLNVVIDDYFDTRLNIKGGSGTFANPIRCCTDVNMENLAKNAIGWLMRIVGLFDSDAEYRWKIECFRSIEIDGISRLCALISVVEPYSDFESNFEMFFSKT